MDSSSASPLIRVAPILLKQRNAFVALGAVGLSLGAAWAWNHRRKPDAEASEPVAPKAASPQKRHRSKRHKSRTKAAAECEQPLRERAAEPVPPPNASSPPASEPAAASAQAAAAAAREQPGERPQQVQEGTPEPEKAPDAGAESDGEPAAGSTGCTQELDVEMTDVATVACSDTETAHDATHSPAEQEDAAGEWRTVGRKQRRRRPSPLPDCLDEPEPQATTAVEVPPS